MNNNKLHPPGTEPAADVSFSVMQRSLCARHTQQGLTVGYRAFEKSAQKGWMNTIIVDCSSQLVAEAPIGPIVPRATLRSPFFTTWEAYARLRHGEGSDTVYQLSWSRIIRLEYFVCRSVQNNLPRSWGFEIASVDGVRGQGARHNPL